MSGYQPYEVLVLALDGGEPFAQAARNAGMTLTDATREAKAFGYPDLEILRGVAAEIRSEHSREESTTMNPRRPASVPIEDDVADALRAGDAVHDLGVTVDPNAAFILDPAATYATLHTSDPGPSRSGVTWRAAGVTDEQLDADVPEASVESVDREVLDGTQALLQLLDLADYIVTGTVPIVREHS